MKCWAPCMVVHSSQFTVLYVPDEKAKTALHCTAVLLLLLYLLLVVLRCTIGIVCPVEVGVSSRVVAPRRAESVCCELWIGLRRRRRRLNNSGTAARARQFPKKFVVARVLRSETASQLARCACVLGSAARACVACFECVRVEGREVGAARPSGGSEANGNLRGVLGSASDGGKGREGVSVTTRLVRISCSASDLEKERRLVRSGCPGKGRGKG